jgi:hypothetical protein
MILSCALVCLPTALAQQDSERSSGLKLYDSFGQTYLDPARWYNGYQCGAPTAMECDRDILNHQLHLRVHAYGSTTSDTGSLYGVSEVALSSTAMTDLVVALTVRKADSQGCPTNPGSNTHGHALLYGTFFNGGGGTPADDVQAFLAFDRYSTDPPGVLEVVGFLGYQGQFLGFVDLGQINVGEQVGAELTWDKSNHRFVVRLFRPTYHTTAEQSMTYSMSDTKACCISKPRIERKVFSAELCGGAGLFLPGCDI